MKIKFLYIENGKITLTKQELETLLEENYQDGVAEGRKANLTYTPDTGKIATQPYETLPHRIYTPDYVYCNPDLLATKVTVNGEALKWGDNGTVTAMASSCSDELAFSAAVTDASVAAVLTQYQTETALEG